MRVGRKPCAKKVKSRPIAMGKPKHHEWHPRGNKEIINQGKCVIIRAIYEQIKVWNQSRPFSAKGNKMCLSGNYDKADLMSNYNKLKCILLIRGYIDCLFNFANILLNEWLYLIMRWKQSCVQKCVNGWNTETFTIETQIPPWYALHDFYGS